MMNNYQITSTVVIIMFFCYLFGSIPVGLLIGRIFKKKDLRYLGSKNIGSTNATRILGLRYGIIIFLLDFLKGFIPVSLFWFDIFPIEMAIKEKRIFFGISAIFGHLFSIFNHFKGGKAIATSVGVISGIHFGIGLLGILFFLFFVILFGYASLASIIATLLVNILLWIYKFFYPEKIKIFELFSILIITIIIFLKHYSNIVKLIKGTENKFNFGFKNKK